MFGLTQFRVVRLINMDNPEPIAFSNPKPGHTTKPNLKFRREHCLLTGDVADPDLQMRWRPGPLSHDLGGG